eukprot:1195189-Prorocentrum_minimum.AAC.5
MAHSETAQGMILPVLRTACGALNIGIVKNGLHQVPTECVAIVVFLLADPPLTASRFWCVVMRRGSWLP